VWLDAAGGIGAYQPAGGDETLPGLLDWRSLLDLLEDRTGRSFDDLWRTWAARSADLPVLDARAAARAHLEETQARAGGWALPRSVREAMRAWRFELAEELLASADRVLTARDGLEAEAASLGLTLPDRLQQVFEGEDGFDVAAAEAAAQRAAVAAIREAVDARPITTSPDTELIVALGLVGVNPEAELASAREAFAMGEVARAFDAAAEAEDLWVAATTVGRNRIVSLALLALSAILLAGLIGWRRRGGVRAGAS